MNKKLTNYFKKTDKNGESYGLTIFFLPFRAIRILYRDLKNILKLKYRRISKNSIFFEKKELEMCSLFPKEILDTVIKLYNPQSVLDLGCGVGRSLDYFKANNINVTGVEGSKMAIAKSLNPELIIHYNLNNPLNLNQRFDLIWSFEFVEHIHPDFVKNLMKTFSNHSDVVVISAAPPGQGGEGHFNEQPPEYWISQFSTYGYVYNKVYTNKIKIIKEMFSKNILIFEKNKNIGKPLENQT
ncbi:MAG: methyltransferase domain-containing protein [Pseudomonadota bacterium]